jgi:hypothetical protein
MAFLRPLVRLIGVAWMIVLALFGLGIAMYCFDGLIGLGSARPDRLLQLPRVRYHVGHFLNQLAASGSTAGLALLCGLGAMLLGMFLLIGVVGRRKQRIVILEHDGQTGAIAARTRPVQDMVRALAEPVRGATSVKRPKLSLPRSGAGGKLVLDATRTRTTDPRELQTAVEQAVRPITEPFHLDPRVRVRLGESGSRVQ